MVKVIWFPRVKTIYLRRKQWIKRIITCTLNASCLTKSPNILIICFKRSSVYVGPVLDTTSRWSNRGELWRRDNKGIISNIFEKYLPERDANINSLDKNSYLFCRMFKVEWFSRKVFCFWIKIVYINLICFKCHHFFLENEGLYPKSRKHESFNCFSQWFETETT